MLFIFVCVVVSQCLLGVYSTIENTKDNNGDHPIIQTQNGAIRGKRAKTVGEQTYYAFQGIPFAEPPIGDRRFKAPEKKSPWKGVLDATQDRSECIQSQNPPTGSEDCLYLNVYTPRLQGKKLPVMAWIYGGGFTFGNSSYKLYGPDYLIEQDVIFVSFNYRLLIFGFGTTDDSVCPGNFGLKDQIMALKWIKENIANFGGDPNRVTLFGESSGSAAVSYLLQTDLTRDLFSAAIMQSGVSICLWAPDRKTKEVMFTIGKALNIDTSSSTTLIDGLRKINATTLQNIALPLSENVTNADLLHTFVFTAAKEVGLVGRYSEQMLSQGRFNRKPLIIGFNSNEIPAAESPDSFKFITNTNQLVPLDLTKNETKIKQAAAEIHSYYFGGTTAAEKNIAQGKFLSDTIHYRPTRRAVIDQSKYVPVYFYKLSYSGVLGRLGQPSNGEQGAAHAEDLPYLFRTYLNTVSREDQLIRSRMVKLWTNFAKYHNPTPAKDSLFQNVTWLTANCEPDKLSYLNIDSKMEIQFNPFDKNMKFWDRIYQKYGDPPFDTY